jgi:hypothetical protein
MKLRWVAAAAVGAWAAMLVLAGPAGAQQLVDAGKEGDGSGGLAFVLFALFAFLMGGAAFFMDRVRRSRLRDEDEPRP